MHRETIYERRKMQASCAHCHVAIELNRLQFGVILCTECEKAWMSVAANVINEQYTKRLENQK